MLKLTSNALLATSDLHGYTFWELGTQVPRSGFKFFVPKEKRLAVVCIT